MTEANEHESAPGHRNGCQGCGDRKPGTYLPCWTAIDIHDHRRAQTADQATQLRRRGARNHVMWKYTLATNPCTLQIPEGAKVVAVGAQDDQVVLWAGVDPDMPTQPRTFVAVATGQEFTAPVYHGTVQMPGGLVWHLMETA